MNRDRNHGSRFPFRFFLCASANPRIYRRGYIVLRKLNEGAGSESFSSKERGLEVTLHNRGQSLGACITLYCLWACLILALFSGSLSRSQETRQLKDDVSSRPELQRGIALAQKGDFKKAEEAFEQAVTLHPSDARALTALGQVQEQLGQLPESIETFNKVIELDPLSAEAHENLGIALGDRADLAAALKESSIATQLAPGSAGAHFLRGRLLSDLGRHQDARGEFRKTLDIAPEDAEALYYWAALEGEEGNATIQESLLTRYLKLRPDQATALDQLGDVLEEEHWESEAIGAWRRAIALNPGYSGAIYSLARALRRTDPVESEQLIERVHELERDQQTIDRINQLGNQANAKMYEANYKGAIDDLKNAIVLCGGCKLLGALEKNIGLAYCHAGQLDAGERELKISETLIPDDPDVKTALQTVEQQRRQALGNSQ
jgi:tetratricopeptide (TPR) repeat protein